MQTQGMWVRNVRIVHARDGAGDSVGRPVLAIERHSELSLEASAKSNKENENSTLLRCQTQIPAEYTPLRGKQEWRRE